MKTVASLVVMLLVLFGILTAISGFKSAHNASHRSPRANYLQYCASCHGQNHERFAARAWVYGNTLSEVSATLKNGRPAIGMPEFANAMTDAEITELANYTIREVAQVPKVIPPTFQLNEVVRSLDINFKLETVASGIPIPWGFDFLPDGTLLVTEKSGKLYSVKNGVQTAISGLPAVVARGQGGLMDVLVHPKFKANRTIYISFVEGNSPDKINTSIARAQLRGNKLSKVEVIYRASPLTNSGVHFGCRLFFDSNGYLYFGIGDRGKMESAQDLTNHNGKIHRIFENGSIPDDNPFMNRQGAVKSIWSYGHRNPQGLYYDKTTHTIWENEHGPKGGDEINVIQKGQNYGWPVVSYGINYDGTVFTNDTIQVGMKQPFHYWMTSIGPSSLMRVSGHRYPSWNGDFLSGSLSFEHVERTLIKNNRVVGSERLMPKIGRVRNVKQGPDGYIYISVERLGKVFRIVPID